MKINNTLILRLEAALFFGFSLYLFYHLNFSWKTFLILFLVPDIALAGYTFGSKIGAIFYNILHSTVMPIILMGFAVYSDQVRLVEIALIWFSHIYGDRLLGIGLKESKGFKHTHLGLMR